MGGVQKFALQLDGVTLLERTLASLGVARSIVIVGDAPQHALEHNPAHTPEHILDTRVSVTREHPAYGGPVAAIGAGIAALDARREPDPDAVLLLAVDMPHVAPLVPELLAALAARPEADAVLALDETQRLQPLAAVYRTVPLRRVLEELATEHPAPHPLASLPLRAITARMVVETIAAPPESTADVDTLDDAARLGITLSLDQQGGRTP